MADQLRNGPVERDIEQAITALKKGAYLLKYGRRGKPKFCPFRLSNDETTLIWYSGKDEKQLKLSSVSRIVPGQRTAIFQRYPRPEKEYQSFSLICNDRSLDLICKDKDEAEVWFTGLRALLSIVPNRKWKLDSKSDGAPSSDVNSPIVYTRKNSPLSSPFGSTESLSQEGVDTNGSPSPYGSPPRYGLGKALSDGELHPMHLKNAFESHSVGGSVHFIGSDGGSENVNAQARVSSLESVRVSMSSAFSSSSQGSGQDDADALGDVYMWGEGVGDGYLGGGVHKIGQAIGSKMDALLPKTFESTAVLDVKYIACGGRHAALVTKQGEAFCWGEESGGRLGHGVDADVSHPQLIESLSTTHVELVACGEYHTCAVSASGELYTWGDGTHNFGLLGHGNDVSHWMPKRINGILDGLRISSVSCGPWHTSLVTSAGQLFTFGDGAFGVLGHGNTCSVSSPREVDLLKGLRTVRVACGVWHTAAVVEVMMGAASNCSSAKLFTWGDGDKGRLGHGDKEQKLVPTCVAALVEYSFKQVACGHSLTVALTTSGQVFTMGSPVYGQLGNPQADGKTPGRVEGKLRDTSVEEIACGAFHVAVLTSRLDIYTWGKGANGRLGHGDVSDRNMPTLVEALKDKHAKAVSCGSSFTAAICLHKWVSGADQSMCSGCRLPFGFTRKRHNCYNCGLVFCHNCSSKKALKASLAPCQIKPYRVCDPCSLKLKKAAENGYMSKALSLKKVGISRASPPEIKERTDVKIPRPQPQFSKIASLDQFKLEETKSFSRRNSRRPDSTSSSRVSPVRNGSSLWGVPSAPPSVHLAFGPPRRMQSASVPHSRIVSRATSPISSRRASPPRATAAPVPIFMGLNFPKTIDEDTKKTNEALSQEVVKLRSQVDNLSRCRQLQEVELKRLTHQLQEAINIAEDESSKCKAAKEVIKSLTSQLKDMAERLPGGLYRNPRQGMVPSVHANGLNGSLSQQVRGSEIPDTIQPLFRSLAESPVEPTTKASVVLSSLSDRALRCTGGNQVANDGNRSDGHQSIIGNGDDAATPTGNGNGAPNEPEEWVVQDEPGVYITLTSLPGDGKDLKRVRFSRKRFSEKQAELWWQENKARVHEQYNVRVVERSSITGLPRADEERGPFATSSSSID